MTDKFKYYRFIIWLTLVLLLVFLAYQAIVPSGQITYNYDLTNSNEFIGLLTPADRVERPVDGIQKIIGNPVYFSLRTTRPFQRAKVTYRIKNSAETSLIESGILVDGKAWRYDTKPLQNLSLDNLIKSGDWGLIETDGLMLLQRQERYNSIDDFLAQVPDSKEMALYNYNLKANFKLSDYQSSSTLRFWPYPLRGNYQFYTYLKNEALDITLLISDINENADADALQVLLYDQDNKVIKTWSLPDDGISDPAYKIPARELALTTDKLAEGVYKVELKANSDIITDSIKTRHSKLAFINRLWLAPASSAINLTASGSAYSFQTINPASRQEIKFGAEAVLLNQTYRQIFSRGRCGAQCSIQLARADVIVAGEGVLGLTADNLIDPRFQNLNSVNNSLGSIKYILARYTRPKVLANGWLQLSAEFDLTGAYREDNKYSLILSAPSLSAEDELADYVEIDNIQVELSGLNWWEIIKALVKKI